MAKQEIIEKIERIEMYIDEMREFFDNVTGEYHIDSHKIDYLEKLLTNLKKEV
jgi:hypothetical protein